MRRGGEGVAGSIYIYIYIYIYIRSEGRWEWHVQE
jgi:hypothetical protein